jgi:hypothetical protein
MADTFDPDNSENKTILQQLPFLREEKSLIGGAEKRLLNYIRSVSKMPSSKIDAEIASQIVDLDFMVDQVKADLNSYSSNDDCRRISHDILIRQVRIAILKSEIDRRSELQGVA